MNDPYRFGYWFAASDYLPNGDGRKVEVGKSLSVTDKLEMCRNGLHYSVHPVNALTYAKGFILYRVEALGEILVENDKCCTSKRLHVARADAKETVLLFARKQALKVIHLWDAPDIVREFLNTGANAVDAANVANALAAHATYAAAYAAYAAANASYAAAYAAYPAYAASNVAYAASNAAADAAYAAGDAYAVAAEFKEMIEALFAK